MASPKNLLGLLIDLSKTLSNFLRSRTTSFLASFFVISLFFFAGFLAGNPPAANLPFAPRVLASSNSSSSLLISSAVAINSRPSDNRSNVVPEVILLKNFSTVVERNENSRQLAIEGLVSCDIFDGNWMVDESSNPSYEPGSCPFLDDAFNCVRNGRPDSDFMKLRWQPKKCKIPRLNGKEMLEMVRGKRLVFVGDSLNRNMWESLVCVLRGSLVDKNTVSEISGRHEFRTDGFYAFRFSDYNCSIEFVRSPFLVQEWEMPDSKGVRKQTLRLDLIQESSSKYKDADIIIFNTGHWWTHEKTSRGKDYYQEGDHVYKELNVAEAYKKALRTWATWVDANINPNRTRVFFRGYSASHFRGGQWHSGGNCDGETQPIKNDEHLTPYPKMMITLESVIRLMKTPVFYLNITRMTDYRKDGHPSVFRQPATERQPNAFQDCSHWCLPGVPDAWNELLYVALLISNSGHHNHLQSEG